MMTQHRQLHFFSCTVYNKIMSGHSHWAGIKHKKEITDQKRAKIFSKLLALISAAARTEPNPDFNPRLRSAILKAKEMTVPQDNIDRAVKKASEAGNNLEELLFESYGPGGIAVLIEAVSDNKNRAVQEIKTILKDHNGKWAESGSVQWAFDKTTDGYTPKFPQDISETDARKLIGLIEALEDNDNVQNVTTNAASLPAANEEA
jgi:transcriptional/translational regulatory protein YebC/TACO1